jgi:putative heme iron utilization protein
MVSQIWPLGGEQKGQGMDESDGGAVCRRLMRRQTHAALATSRDGHPYVSLAALAFEYDASPLLLLSDLAQHSRNIAADRRVSLLFDGGAPEYPRADPLAEPRLTLLGEAARCDDPRLLARFTARHPSAAVYAGFGDFHLYRVILGRGHLVAGFGQISWIEGAALRFAGDGAALAAAECEIVEHMNDDHAGAVGVFAERLARRSGAGWRMIGIDPEGIDLRRDGETARIDFATHSLGPALDPRAARQALIALTAVAREAPAL